MNKLVLTAFVALLAPGMAHAFCPTPKVLQPGPGEVTGCPVYAKTNNGPTVLTRPHTTTTCTACPPTQMGSTAVTR